MWSCPNGGIWRLNVKYIYFVHGKIFTCNAEFGSMMYGPPDCKWILSWINLHVILILIYKNVDI